MTDPQNSKLSKMVLAEVDRIFSLGLCAFMTKEEMIRALEAQVDTAYDPNQHMWASYGPEVGNTDSRLRAINGTYEDEHR